MKRQRVDLIAAVLAAAGSGAGKTRIMRTANLSYDLLLKYLGEAEGNAFLKFNGDGYEITTKGRGFLDEYKQYFEEYSKMQSNIQSLMAKWEALEEKCPKCKSNNPRSNGETAEHNVANELENDKESQ